MTTPPDRPSLQLETLEGRTLFAGNVTASVIESHLFIRGDGKDNVVRITEGLNPGEIKVDGIRKTKLDKGSSARVFSGGITDLRIAMGGGDDIVRIKGIDVTGHLRIQTGKGRDRVAVRDTDVNATMRIDTRRGRDTVIIERVTVAQRARVRGGTFADSITINESTFGENLVLRGQGGEDEILVSANTTYQGELVITGGPGNDRVRRNV